MKSQWEVSKWGVRASPHPPTPPSEICVPNAEKAMATHSSVVAWRIPGTGKPGGLPSMGLHRVGHDWSDLAAAAA